MEEQTPSTPPSQPSGKSANNTPMLLAILVIILVGIAGFLLMNKKPQQASVSAKSPQPTEAMKMQDASISPTATSGAMQPSGSMQQNVKEFTVTGSNFAFVPNELKVKKGDTVKITFKNSGGMHDFVLDEFKAKTDIIKGGEQAEVTFTADKAGSFEYYCSVGSHRAMGMKGTLIVE
jgi:nitrosocyanin